MKMPEMLKMLTAALSSGPCEDANVLKCFAEDQPVAQGEKTLGCLVTDHPEIVRLFELSGSLIDKANEIIKGLTPEEYGRQSLTDPVEWQTEVTNLKYLADSVCELAWSMTRNVYSARQPGVAMRSGWQVVEYTPDDEDEEGDVLSNPFMGGGVMHVVMIGGN